MTFEKISKPGAIIGTGELFVPLKLTTLLLALSLIFSAYAVPNLLLTNLHTSAAEKVTMTNGADQWDHDTNVTPPYANFPSALQGAAVAPVFQSYYQQHDGISSLGKPLTVALPTPQGWLQFFENSALLFPLQHALPAQISSTFLNDTMQAETKDTQTGIIRIPLLQALLTAGSQLAIGGQGGSLTYVDLRKAAASDFVQALPITKQATALAVPDNQDMLIPVGHRGETIVGHRIPKVFWNYMNLPPVSPDGWQKDFGVPLTEALPLTLYHNNLPHHTLVQAFARDALIYDQDAQSNAGQPAIQRLPIGLDYLRTFNFPAITLEKYRTVWSQQETALQTQPDHPQAVAHVGQHFPLMLLGDTAWAKGQLWYHVQWFSSRNTGTGWILSSSTTFSAPTTSAAATASFDALSSDLAHRLTTLGTNVSMSVYDVSRQRNYTYNADKQFIAASSIKVPIMLTFLNLVEQQKREPDQQEMTLLTKMIENSDNDAASTLYYNKIGGAAGLTTFLQQHGIKNFVADPNAWGYSQFSTQTMVDLLTLLENGNILTPEHRDLAQNLMRHVETDQRFGVGDTAPAGATVSMKNGWVTDPNNLWAVNSSGIVTVNQETYIIAVYTEGQTSLNAGETLVGSLCKNVATLLS